MISNRTIATTTVVSSSSILVSVSRMRTVVGWVAGSLTVLLLVLSSSSPSVSSMSTGQIFYTWAFQPQHSNSPRQRFTVLWNDKTTSSPKKQPKGEQSPTIQWTEWKRRFYNGIDDVTSLVQGSQEATTATTNNRNNARQGLLIQNNYVSGVADDVRPKKASTRIANQVSSSSETTTISSLSSSTSSSSSPVRPGPTVSLQKQNQERIIPSDMMAVDANGSNNNYLIDQNKYDAPSTTWQTRTKNKSTNTIAMSSLEIRSRPSRNRRIQEERIRLSENDSMSNNQLIVEESNRRRLEADLKIREEEARARAAIRNDPYACSPSSSSLSPSTFSSQKFNVNKNKKKKINKPLNTNGIVKSLQSGIDNLPGAIDTTMDVAKSIPTTIQSLPDTVEQRVRVTQESFQRVMEETQQVANDIQDIPKKASKTIETTQQNLREVQNSMNNVVTSAKVLVGIEKPKPKPPQVQPPPLLSKSAKDIAKDVAGQTANMAGTVAWWSSKQLAKVAWKGTQIVVTKGVETITPVLEEVWDETFNNNNNNSSNNSDEGAQDIDVMAKTPTSSSTRSQGIFEPKPPTTLPKGLSKKDDDIVSVDVGQIETKKMEDEEEPTMVAYTTRQQEFIDRIQTKQDLQKEIDDAKALADEVAAALELAERALEISNNNDDGYKPTGDSMDDVVNDINKD